MHDWLHHFREETQRLLTSRDDDGGDARLDPSGARLRTWLVLLLAGTACYGASIGLWRAPMQAVFVAVKMPMLILLTLVLNGLLNGMLAAILGAALSFRQTVVAIGRSFAIFALVVGALGPVAALFTITLPGWGEPDGVRWYRALLLAHTGVIAVGGIVANLRLLRLLEVACGKSTARPVVVAWLAGNLFVGAQLSYTLRPFFGNPDLPVQFLRPNPFQGNFYEAIWRIGRQTLRDLSD